MKLAMIVVAAGQGARFGQAMPKAFVPLLGQSLVERSIRALAAAPSVSCVVPVVAASQLQRFGMLPLGDVSKLADPVRGGAERQDSVANGLGSLGDEFDLIGVHDAARCLVSVEEIENVVACADETGAALLARPVRDTIKAVEAGCVVGSPDRSSLWAAQTPQVFRGDWLRAAHASAAKDGFFGTDEAELVARTGHRVHVVEGSERNLKLTHPGDLSVAKAWLNEETPEGGARRSQETE